MNIISSYLKEVAKYPLLNEDEERELFLRGKQGDVAAKEKFINSNLRLVIKIAKKYCGKAEVPFADLIQEGNYGLLKAYDKYEIDKGFKFSTYAVYWIKQSIILAIEKSRTVRIPKNVIDSLSCINKFCYEYKQKHTSDPSIAQIAAGTSLTESRIKLLLFCYAPNAISLESPLDEEEELTLGDIVPDTKVKDFLSLVEEEEKKKAIQKVLDTLSEKEKSVIIYRFGFNDSEPKTLLQTGELLGISKERVRQIENNALKKLRHPSRTKKLETYR